MKKERKQGSKEARKQGRVAEGRSDGREGGMKEGRKQGSKEESKQGRKQARKEARKEGRVNGHGNHLTASWLLAHSPNRIYALTPRDSEDSLGILPMAQMFIQHWRFCRNVLRLEIRQQNARTRQD
jgi:hypothetical protein